MKSIPNRVPPQVAIASIHRPVDIWVLVYPDFLLLDATGPVQVFSTANDDARDMELPQPYRIALVSKIGGAVRSCSGVTVLTQRLPRPPRPLSRQALLARPISAETLGETP